MAETWDETKPAGSRNPKLGDDDIREFKRAMRERLNFDHEFTSTESPAFGAASSKIGTHNAIRLNEQASDPATLANQGAVYAKEAGSVTELHMRPESSGTVKQLTRGGMQKLNALPFNDGTYDLSFPTNQPAAATFMFGNNNTVTWFFNNTAPPFWKIILTGDYVLGVGATGGVTEGSWTISGHTIGSENAHTHAHLHTWYKNEGTLASDKTYNSGGNAITLPRAAMKSVGAYQISNEGIGVEQPMDTSYTDVNETAGSSHAHSSTFDGSWRPARYIGKLCQLDIA